MKVMTRILVLVIALTVFALSSVPIAPAAGAAQEKAAVAPSAEPKIVLTPPPGRICCTRVGNWTRSWKI